MADRSNSEVGHRPSIWDRLRLGPDGDHMNPREREQLVTRILNDIGFNWTVFIATSAGFLASSYTIFSSNIVGPALQFVYPEDEHGFKKPKYTIDMVTLGTTILGMIIFGHLADRLGRKRLYGLELVIIILGTVGMIQSSDGISVDGEHSLNVYAAIATWRGIQGIGIGAEYPLSALIAAEFSSTETRGTIMASVFAMQSVGRILAYLVTIWALKGDQHSQVAIDRIWRLVVGIGAIPALLAIGLRLTIPETPRYYVGIEKDLKKAAQAVQRVGGTEENFEKAAQAVRRVRGIYDDMESIHSDIQPTTIRKDEFSASWFSSAWDYLFGTRKAWKPLLGIVLQWFLLDVAFYGLGLDSPSTIHGFWLDEKPSNATACSTMTITSTSAFQTTQSSKTSTVTHTKTFTKISAITASPPLATQAWNEDEGKPCTTIDGYLDKTARRTLQLVSVASLLGSLAAIFIINRFSRRRLLAFSCGVLCLLFLATGISVWLTSKKSENEVSMVFFALIQFMFNLGPNTLTFIIPAESFATPFRGTFYGLAAAGGKAGALMIRPIIHRVESTGPLRHEFYYAFSAVMLVMVGIALVPGSMLDAQHPRHEGSSHCLATAEKSWLSRYIGRLRNKSLEDIAANPE